MIGGFLFCFVLLFGFMREKERELKIGILGAVISHFHYPSLANGCTVWEKIFLNRHFCQGFIVSQPFCSSLPISEHWQACVPTPDMFGSALKPNLGLPCRFQPSKYGHFLCTVQLGLGFLLWLSVPTQIVYRFQINFANYGLVSISTFLSLFVYFTKAHFVLKYIRKLFFKKMYYPRLVFEISGWGWPREG